MLSRAIEGSNVKVNACVVEYPYDRPFRGEFRLFHSRQTIRTSEGGEHVLCKYRGDVRYLPQGDASYGVQGDGEGRGEGLAPCLLRYHFHDVGNHFNVRKVRGNFCRGHVRSSFRRDFRLFLVNDNRFVMYRDARNQVVSVQARKADFINEACQAYCGSEFVENLHNVFIDRFTDGSNDNRVGLATRVLRVVVYRQGPLNVRHVYFGGVDPYFRVFVISVLCRVETNGAGRIVVTLRLSKRLDGALSPRVLFERVVPLCRDSRYAVGGRGSLIG